jgi:hypothetical protein
MLRPKYNAEEELAIYIVEQTARDYKKDLKNAPKFKREMEKAEKPFDGPEFYKWKHRYYAVLDDIEDCEAFFAGKLVGALTSMSAEEFIKRIKGELNIVY